MDSGSVSGDHGPAGDAHERGRDGGSARVGACQQVGWADLPSEMLSGGQHTTGLVPAGGVEHVYADVYVNDAIMFLFSPQSQKCKRLCRAIFISLRTCHQTVGMGCATTSGLSLE